MTIMSEELNWDDISHFQEATGSPGFMLWQTYLLWKRKLDRLLSPRKITHVQFVILTSLAYLQGKKIETNQNNLAKISMCDVSMASQVIRALVKKGLIERMQKEGDERSKFLTLTPDGIKLVKKTVKNVEDIDSKFFSHIKGKQKSFLECLTIIVTSESETDGVKVAAGGMKS